MDTEQGSGWETERLGLTCIHCCCCCLVAQSLPTLLQPHRLKPTRLLHPWDFPGKSSGVGCHYLLQGIFSTPGIEPGCPALQAGSLLLSHHWVPISSVFSKSCLNDHLLFIRVLGFGDNILPFSRILSQRNYESRFLKAIFQDSSEGQGVEELMRAF